VVNSFSSCLHGEQVCVAALLIELDRAREDPASPALSVAPDVVSQW
jgi:hypothetical protein